MSDQPEQPFFFSVRDVAQRWTVHPKTVMREIERGRLRALRVGRQLRIHRNELARYEERHEFVPPTVRGVRP
jgi:excisionase family DNA binding protein